MDIEINNTKQQAQFKNGKYYQLFTPTAPNEKIKLYHMGCVGDTRLTHIQLEKGSNPTSFVVPKQKANSLSGIFQKLRDINVLMKDSDSEFWTRIKQNARGTIEEYHNNTLKNEITKTAEGMFEKQTKTINTNIDEKIKTAKTAIDKTITAETKKFADELSSRITTVQNESVKKNEVSVTENGVRIGSTELIDGRKLTSIITTQPENIKAITDKMIITPANENLVMFEFRENAFSESRDTWITPEITSDTLTNGNQFIIEGIGTWNGRLIHDLNFIIAVKYKSGNWTWITSRLKARGEYANSTVPLTTTLTVDGLNEEVAMYRLGLQQPDWSNFTNITFKNAKIYKKKSAELIVDGSIEGRQIKANTLETGHHKSGSITSDIIAANAVKVNHIDINDALIRELVAHKAFVNQLWAQQAFINNLKTINFDFTKGTGSYIQSKDGGMKWDLDNNELIMDKTSFIKFKQVGNALTFEDRNNTSSGITFSESLGTKKAAVTIGTTAEGSFNHNSDTFAGLISRADEQTVLLTGDSVIIGRNLNKTIEKDADLKLINISDTQVYLSVGHKQGFRITEAGPFYDLDGLTFSFYEIHRRINMLIAAIRNVANNQVYKLPGPYPTRENNNS